MPQFILTLHPLTPDPPPPVPTVPAASLVLRWRRGAIQPPAPASALWKRVLECREGRSAVLWRVRGTTGSMARTLCPIFSAIQNRAAAYSIQKQNAICAGTEGMYSGCRPAKSATIPKKIIHPASKHNFAFFSRNRTYTPLLTIHLLVFGSIPAPPACAALCYFLPFCSSATRSGRLLFCAIVRGVLPALLGWVGSAPCASRSRRILVSYLLYKA